MLLWMTLALLASEPAIEGAKPIVPGGLPSPTAVTTPTTPTAPTAPTAAVTTPTPTPAPMTDLMRRHAHGLRANASSVWPGWEAVRIIDGKRDTSWFSAGGDTTAKGKSPWVEVQFPVDVDVKKVMVLGNVEPDWPQGFTVRYGRVDLTDANGKVLQSMKNEGKNRVADMDFVFKQTVRGVRAVRFTSLLDDGAATHFEEVAIAEMLIE